MFVLASRIEHSKYILVILYSVELKKKVYTSLNYINENLSARKN